MKHIQTYLTSAFRYEIMSKLNHFHFIGGPLVQKDDGTLIGVISFYHKNRSIEDAHLGIDQNVCANIRYYFDWIRLAQMWRYS